MQKIKRLILVAVAACFMVVFVTGCPNRTTAGVDYDPGLQNRIFGVGGKICIAGVCVSPEARINASAPSDVVIVQPTPTPPVVAYAPPAAALYPPARSYNETPVLPVRTLEK